MYPLGDRSHLRTSGRARSEIRYAADQNIRTSLGAFVARRIEGTFTANLTHARVLHLSSDWYVDGVGMVAERQEERTSIFGIPARRNRSAWTSSDGP